MSLLASLAFALTAFVIVAALRLTIRQYRAAALGNIAALRDCGVSREYRVQTMTVMARKGCAEVQRIAPRTAARRFKSAEGLRAAA